jgi:hypothetical protein
MDGGIDDRFWMGARLEPEVHLQREATTLTCRLPLPDLVRRTALETRDRLQARVEGICCDGVHNRYLRWSTLSGSQVRQSFAETDRTKDRSVM